MPDAKKNQGEGNREADRAYRQDTKDFIATHDVAKLGKQAKEALAKDPAGLKAAEDKGKAKARR